MVRVALAFAGPRHRASSPLNVMVTYRRRSLCSARHATLNTRRGTFTVYGFTGL